MQPSKSQGRQWESAWRCAGTNTFRFAYTPLFWGAVVVVIALSGGLAATYASNGWTTPQQAWFAAGVAITAGLLLGLATFFIYLAKAPYRQRNEVRREIEGIEAKRHTPLILSVRTGRDDHHRHPHLMWAELDVYNSSDVAIHGVEVRIEDLRDDQELDKNTGEPIKRVQDWSPFHVVWSPRNAPLNQSQLIIPAGETRTTLIAYSDDSNGPPALFAVVNEGPGNRRRLSSGMHRIEVRVSNPDTEPCVESFYLECHPNYLGGKRSHMEFERWQEWWETKQNV